MAKSVRLQLAEIAAEDGIGPSSSEIGFPKSARSTSRPAPAPGRNRKSDFVKVSITLPPAVFDQLEDLSRQRRRAGRPFTRSDLVREALEVWLGSK